MTYMLRDIAVFFDASEDGRRILDIGVHLAERLNAYLIGISSIPNDAGPPEDTFVRGKAMKDVIKKRNSSTTAQLLRAGQYLSKVTARHGIGAEFRVIPYTGNEDETSIHSLFCDLLIVGDPAVGAPLDWSSIQMLQKTGVPVLIIPNTWTSLTVGRKIVVAWNESRQARRAIADALPILVQAEEVDLLIVDPSPESEEPGADMAAYLARHGVPHVELLRQSSRNRFVADIVLEQAAQRNADLIVFGAFSRPQISEALFGGVTVSLLSSGKIPLFISR